MLFVRPAVKLVVVATVNGTPNVLIDGVMTSNEVSPGTDGRAQLSIKGDEIDGYRIYNILGQDVLQLTKAIQNIENHKPIDMSHLVSGIYVVKTKEVTTKVHKK